MKEDENCRSGPDYRLTLIDREAKIRRQVDRICSRCSHLNRERVEQLIFEAGLPVVMANLEEVDENS